MRRGISLLNNETINPLFREILINRGACHNTNLPNNYISTAKYTLFTIIPKNLFEQFHRIANFWFLIVSILQLLPLQLSPTSSWATIAPLGMVLLITMLKDAYLDYLRHKSDNDINNRITRVWNDEAHEFQPVFWKDLKVGNIVYLEQDDQIPADCVLLYTSEKAGVCYIETSNLDGETNYKIKRSMVELANFLYGSDVQECMSNLNGLDDAVLKVENPNNKLYQFSGSIKLTSNPKGISINNDNVILRGCTMKNTKWMIGILVYTGVETKLMQNSKAPPHKRSTVERKTNKYLTLVFSLLFIVAILSTILSIITAYKDTDRMEFFSAQDSRYSSLNIISYLILYNGLVPISLYVTIDLVRVIQAKFIMWDTKMYYEENDQPAIAKTGDLNEELGQVEFIFSDKTGTLTENKMEFKRCSIKGKLYGSIDPIPTKEPVFVNFHPRFKFYDPELLKDIKLERNSYAREFILALALCHTITPELNSGGEINFQGTSPDEEALVIAAHALGYTLNLATGSHYILKLGTQKQKYKIIGVNEFNSNRKRMSIVVKSERDDSVVLYCKGADNVIKPLLNMSPVEEHEFDYQIREFSMQGLRTLVVAKRMLKPEEYEDYEKKYSNARNAMSERERCLEDLASEFEKGLELIGITGIEDRIQQGVPETIDKLLKADIKMWVLTGDKMETAINIGFSCSLFESDMEIITLSCNSEQEAYMALQQNLTRFLQYKQGSGRIDEVVSQATLSRKVTWNLRSVNSQEIVRRRSVSAHSEIGNVDNLNIGLVVDGKTLELIFKNVKTIKYFMMLGLFSHSVICCRVTPLQKAKVVALAKKHYSFKPITLAIGDGANDVSMIQEANVGVGIVGKEGLQAANSSDYAIARFQYLLPLILVHGRWNYLRITRVILYCFYKNFLMVLPMFLFSFLNLYSGTALYDSWLIMSYNVIWTAIPIIILGTTDRDMDKETILQIPSLYCDKAKTAMFTAKSFIFWITIAIIQSVTIYMLTYASMNGTMDKDGNPENLSLYGTVTYIVVVFTATYTILSLMQSWSKLFSISIGLSMIILIAFIFLYDYAAFPSDEMMGISTKLFTTPNALISMFLNPIASSLVTWGIFIFMKIFFPSLSDKVDSQAAYISNIPDDKVYLLNNRAREFKDNPRGIFNAKGIQALCKVSSDETETLDPDKYTLKFKNKQIETEYRNAILKQGLKFTRVVIILMFIFNMILNINTMISSSEPSSIVALRLIVMFAAACVVVVSYLKFFEKHNEAIVVTVISIAMIVKIMFDIIAGSDGSMATALIIIITFVIFKAASYKLIIVVGLYFIVFMIRVSIFYTDKLRALEAWLLILHYISLLFAIILIGASVCYTLEMSRRMGWIITKLIKSELVKGQEILGNLLPPFVKEKVKEGSRYIALPQEGVTVLFCDIYDFDNICANYEPNELTELLDNFFALLDHLCEKYGVTKIETVNKTYMVCGGIKEMDQYLPISLKSKNHAQRTVEFALDVIRTLKQVYLNYGKKFQVKIGINSGPVIAGVVGSHKPQFALVGDTVNTASRMGSTIKTPDTVQISMSTYELVAENDWGFEPNQVEAKGKGLLDTFFVFLNSSSDIIQNNTSIKDVLQELQLHEDSPYVSVPLHSMESCEVSVNMSSDSHTVLLESTTMIDKNATFSSTRSLKSKKTREFFNEMQQGEVLPDEVEYKPLDLHWHSKDNEVKYHDNFLAREMWSIKLGMVMSTIIFVLMNISYIIRFKYDDSGNIWVLVLRWIPVFMLVGIACKLHKLVKTQKIGRWLLVTYMLESVIITLALIDSEDIYIYTTVLLIMYCNVVLNHTSCLYFMHILLSSILILIIFIAISVWNTSASTAIETIIFLFFFLLFNGAASYIKESSDRKTYNLNLKALHEINKTENLLKHMVPAHVLKKLKNDITTTDRYKDVTIIFADICGFTNWSSNKKPIEVVGMLSKLFTKFDNLCEQNQVYKVHTIGDCYVVLGLLVEDDDSSRDPMTECLNMVQMALSMINCIKDVNREEGLELNMRIGIHTGDIVAGITGTKIVRYDIYGPDVDFANKMESGGQAGQINVSEITKAILEKECPNRFSFEYNKDITHNPVNKTLKSYFLEEI